MFSTKIRQQKEFELRRRKEKKKNKNCQGQKSKPVCRKKKWRKIKELVSLDKPGGISCREQIKDAQEKRPRTRTTDHHRTCLKHGSPLQA